MKPYIEGSGGLFSKPKTKTFERNDADAYSTSFITITDVLGEGKFEKINQIYLDNTPVFDANGNNINFPGVTFEIRYGTPTQELTSSRPGSSVVKGVGVEIKKVNPPVIREYTGEGLDKLIVTTRWSIVKENEDGIFGDHCLYRIYIKSGSGPFELALERGIGGLYPSPIEIQDEFILNNQNGLIDTFQVKVEKVDDDEFDDGTTKITRTMEWFTTALVVTDRITYENTAYAQISFPSEIFDGDVERKYDVFAKVFPIPSNATVDPVDGGLNFNGVWDGTLRMPDEATTDGVWQMLGLLVDDFYGAGNKISISDVNLADLYEISRHNNEYVSNGQGGFERRYSCSFVRRNRVKAKKLLDDFCNNFNANYFNYAGQLRFWQDRPTDEVTAIITNSDIEGGDFIYGFSGVESKASIYRVDWNSPLNDYKEVPELVRYQKGLQEINEVERQIETYGITRKSQAIRKGREAIYDNWLNTKTINFKTRTKGIYLMPGKLISIGDIQRMKFNYAGLVSSSTSNTIILDSDVNILPNRNYTIQVSLEDGGTEERAITTTPGKTNELTVSTDFTTPPESETSWVIYSSDKEVEKYRIIDVIINQDFSVEVIGVLYKSDKWSFIEENLKIDDETTLGEDAPDNSPAPTNLNVTQFLTAEGNISLLCDWEPPSNPYVKSFVLQTSRDGVTWSETVQISQGTAYLKENVPDGFFQFRIATLTILNQYSEWVESPEILVHKVNTQMNLSSPYAWEY